MKRLLHILLLLGITIAGYAQDKSAWHYMDHKDEILPDARALFKQGEYRRVLDLCDLYKDLVGEEGSEAKTVTSLREISLKALILADDMAEKLADGKEEEAITLALMLKEINPDDARAKIADPESVEVPQIGEIAIKSFRVPNRIVARVGGKLFGLGSAVVSVGPVFGLGVYNLGASRWGFDLDAYISSKLGGSTATVYGADLMVVFRAADRFYLALGAGAFSCKDSNDKKLQTTSGLCIPACARLILGKGFTIGADVSYYPAIKLFGGMSTSSYGGAPVIKDVLPVSVVPSVSLGYAF